MKKLWGLQESGEQHLFMRDESEAIPEGDFKSEVEIKGPGYISNTVDISSPLGKFVFDYKDRELIADEFEKLAKRIRETQ